MFNIKYSDNTKMHEGIRKPAQKPSKHNFLLNFVNGQVFFIFLYTHTQIYISKLKLYPAYINTCHLKYFRHLLGARA